MCSGILLSFLDFSQSAMAPSLNDRFGPDNLMGIIEAKNFCHVEKILRFLVTFNERSLHETDDAPTTCAFVLYTNVTLLYRVGIPDHWTSSDLICCKLS